MALICVHRNLTPRYEAFGNTLLLTVLLNNDIPVYEMHIESCTNCDV